MSEDWIAVLEKRCRASSQAAVARELDVSASTVNQVIKGTYKASTDRIEMIVRGKFMAETVRCPLLGVIASHDCASNQRRKQVTANPMRARLARTCPTCPNCQGASDAG